MRITDPLREEHQLILQYLTLLQEYANFDAANDNVDNSLLLIKTPAFISFVRKFADGFHHQKEEQVLFKYLSGPDVPADNASVAELLATHVALRELITRMEYAASFKDVEAIITNVRQFTGLLVEHILTEETVLYQRAELDLTEPEKRLILEEFTSIEQQQDAQSLKSESAQLFESLQTALTTYMKPLPPA